MIQILPNRLHRKIALTFIFLLIVFSIVQYVLLESYILRALAERDQRMYWNLAENLTEVIGPALEKSKPDIAFRRAVLEIRKTQPSLDLYVLSNNGVVSHASRAAYSIWQNESPAIDFERVKEFTTPQINRTLPLLIPHPNNLDEMVIFSAAKFKSAGETHYLLAIIPNVAVDRLSRDMRVSYLILGGALSQILIVVLMSVFGGILFHFITRRFEKLSDTVKSISEGNLQARVPVEGNDEIADLGTRINRMVEAISQNISDFEQMDQHRRELVANISHDLGGPLTSIEGYLETLLENDDALSKEETRRRVQIALRSARTLARMVQELFALSKLESKEVMPQATPFRLEELLTEEIIPQLSVYAEQRGVEILLDIQEDVRPCLADIDMIQRVLMNLIENAIHYHDKDRGAVNVSLRNEESGVAVRVEDNGPGIPAEEVPKIFDRFYRAKQTKEEISGTGLGLAIVRSMLEAHGVRISVDSTIGEGTSFSFILPFEAAAERQVMNR